MPAFGTIQRHARIADQPYLIVGGTPVSSPAHCDQRPICLLQRWGDGKVKVGETIVGGLCQLPGKCECHHVEIQRFVLHG